MRFAITCVDPQIGVNNGIGFLALCLEKIREPLRNSKRGLFKNQIFCHNKLDLEIKLGFLT